MAKYRITGPDGGTYEITAPDDASESDVLAYAQRNVQMLPKTQAAPATEATPAPEAPAASAPQQQDGPSIGRLMALAGEGGQQSVADTIGAIPGLVARGMNSALGTNIDPSIYSRGIKSGLEGIEDVGRFTADLLGMKPQDQGSRIPEGPQEKAAYGAGRGAMDAATIALPAGALARGAQAGTMTQGVGQALAAQPVTQMIAGAAGGAVGGATDNPLLGLAASLAVPMAAAGARRVVSPVQNQLTPQEMRLANIAAREGVELTPGQATGSRPLQTAERVLSRLPLSSNRQNQVFDREHQQFNRAVLRRAGINAERADPQVIDGAFGRIGQAFDNVAARTTVNIDPQFFGQVDNVAQEYGRRLPTDVAPVFQSYMDDINQMRAAVNQPGVTAATIDGQTYGNIHSKLRDAARNAKSRPDLQNALNNLVKTFDDAMGRSVPRDLADNWAEARRQYRNLLMIDKAAGGGTQAGRSTGNIDFGALTSAVRQSDPRGFARGRGEMNELARLGDFLASRIPNSGTPEQQWMSGLLTGAPVTGGIGLAAMGVNPVAAAGGAAMTYGLPPLVQSFMNSQAGRAYLTNQLATGTGPTINRGLLAALLAQNEGGQATMAISAP
jgi:hypothetical protein